MRPLLLALGLLTALSLVLAPRAGAVGSTGGGAGSNGLGEVCIFCSGGGGGGSVGSIFYSELKNTDADKPYYPTAAIKKLREKSSAGGNLSDTWEKASREMQAPCKGGGNNWYKQNGCVLWDSEQHTKSSAWSGIWNEIHTYNTEGGQSGPDIIVGYNVKIWRENRAKEKFDLIFERRVGLPNEGDADPLKNNGEDSHLRWWYGGYSDDAAGENGKGGRYSLNRTSAGMLGTPTSKDVSNCKQNYGDKNDNRNGNRIVDGRKVSSTARHGRGNNWCYWEGSDIGPEYFRWPKKVNGKWDDPSGALPILQDDGVARDLSLPRDQFGSEKNSTKGPAGEDDLGAAGKGLKEAIYLEWTLPRKPTGTFDIKYRIDGAPGLFYVVQIAAIDHRERILPLKAGAFSYRGQLMKAWVSNPTSGGCVPPDPACAPESFGTGAPMPSSSLDAETTLQTREQSSQQVTLDLPDVLYGDQAIFPYQTSLIHYTPQLSYSEPSLAGGTAYNTNYVSYGDANAVRRETADVQPPKKLTKGQQLHVQQARIRAAAWVDPGAEDGNVITDDPLEGSVFDFDLTWLRPTLNSPCAGTPELPDSDVAQRPWPATPAKCDQDDFVLTEAEKNAGKKPILNVWDDLLQARMSWEALWVEQLANNEIKPYALGRVNNQLLRCPDEGGDKPLSACNSGFYGLLDFATNRRQQWAQGYMQLASKDGGAAATIKLDTNRPNRVNGAYVYERGGSLVSQPQLQPNLANGRITLNYCDQGLPEGSRVIDSHGFERKAGSFANFGIGDEDCRGYAVKWKWDNDSCEEADGPGNFPLPTLIGLGAADRDQAKAWGDYHDPSLSAAPHQTDYNPTAFKGVPFTGDRPGTDANSGKCANDKIPGRFTKGKWERSYDFKALPDNKANCVFSLSEVNAFNVAKPDGGSRPAGAPKGTAKKCGKGLYSFGFWYPTDAKWEWNESSCEKNVTKQDTELAAEKNDGRYNKTAPAQSGKLGRTANHLVSNDGPHKANDDPYYAANKWACEIKVKMFKTDGKWLLDDAVEVGSGWGNRNTAGALPATSGGTGYIVNFGFNVPNDTELSNSAYSASGSAVDMTDGPGYCPNFRDSGKPGTCWRMRASYDGFSNQVWYFHNAESGKYEIGNSAYVKVFGARSDR